MKKILSTTVLTLALVGGVMPAASADESPSPDFVAPAAPAAPDCGGTSPSVADPNEVLLGFEEPVCLTVTDRTYVEWLYSFIQAEAAYSGDIWNWFAGYVEGQDEAGERQQSYHRHQLAAKRRKIRHQRHVIRHLRAELERAAAADAS